MATAAADATDVRELVAAYEALDLEFGASASAIRCRYRELAQRHHPDKHPHGSPAQAEAASRMAGINAAYELIQDAPLRHYRPPEPVPSVEDTRERHAGFARPLSVAAETFVRMAVGALLGVVLAFLLDGRGVPGFDLYVWILPVVLGFACTSTEVGASTMLRWLYWWA